MAQEGWIYLKLQPQFGYCFGKTGNKTQRDRAYSKENPSIVSVDSFACRDIDAAEQWLIRMTAGIRLLSNSKEWVHLDPSMLTIFATCKATMAVDEGFITPSTQETARAEKRRKLAEVEEKRRQERIKEKSEEKARRERIADERRRSAVETQRCIERQRLQHLNAERLEKQHKEKSDALQRLLSARTSIRHGEEQLRQMKTTSSRFGRTVVGGFAIAFGLFVGIAMLFAFLSCFGIKFDPEGLRAFAVVVSLVGGFWLGHLKAQTDEKQLLERLAKNRAYVRAHG